MIIDLILERKDGWPYDAREFYSAVMEYGGHDAGRITRAMDEGEEPDIREALSLYIINNDYPDHICDYIRRMDWL